MTFPFKSVKIKFIFMMKADLTGLSKVKFSSNFIKVTQNFFDKAVKNQSKSYKAVDK